MAYCENCKNRIECENYAPKSTTACEHYAEEVRQLKPCSFCGGKPYVYTSGNESCGFFEEIICGECGCRTKRLKEGIAKDAWNRRADNDKL